MARDHGADARLMSQCGGLVAPEVASDPAFGRSAIDGQEGQINSSLTQAIFQARKQDGVARVVHGPRAHPDEETKTRQSPQRIAVHASWAAGTA